MKLSSVSKSLTLVALAVGTLISANANAWGDKSRTTAIGGNWIGINDKNIWANASQDAVAVGKKAHATTEAYDPSIDVNESSAISTYNTAVGPYAKAYGAKNSAYGGYARAGLSDGSSSFATAVGEAAKAVGSKATVIGSEAETALNSATAIGYRAQVHLPNGVAIGANAALSDKEITPTGSGHINEKPAPNVNLTYSNPESSVSKAGISVGNRYGARQIKNVADGTELTDVVTVGQLLDVIAQLNAALADKADKIDPASPGASKSRSVEQTREALKKLQQDGALLSPQ